MRPRMMPKYEPILSENGWIYPDGRVALKAKETRKKVPEKADATGFSLLKGSRRKNPGENHNNKIGA